MIDNEYFINMGIKKNLNFPIMTINKLMLLGIFLFLLVLNGSAQVNDNSSTKSYNLHRVAKQQTLYGLSKEYNVTVDEIRQANGGLPDGLKEGMVIKIPVRSFQKDQTSTPEKQIEPMLAKSFEYQARGKEKIFPLAVRYQVSIDSIFALNPGISETLAKDQIIFIPLVKNTKGYITHTLRYDLTINKLAKNYNLSVDEIKAVNPYISKDLKSGQMVRIPVMIMDTENELSDKLLPSIAEVDENEETDMVAPVEVKCEKDHRDEIFKIALMIPFYFDHADSLTENNLMPEGTPMAPKNSKSFTFIQFYEGFLMAVDSLRRVGLNCELYVFNVEDDIFEVKKILNNPDLKFMDLIVGPVFAKTFSIVAAFAKQHEINIVNPFSVRNEITFDNPFVFKLKSSLGQQYETLANFLNYRYSTAEIYLVRQNQYRDENEISQLKMVLDDRLIKNSLEPYCEINYGNDSLASFLQRASSMKPSVIIIYSENKAFILDMLRKLNEIRDKFQITVVGLPNWKKMEDIEIEYLINLQTHLLVTDFINYNSLEVKRFVGNFRQKYDTEPMTYAFDGYDAASFFLNALMKYGRDFGECVENFAFDGLQSGYSFEKTGNNGFTNKMWKVLKVSDYQFINVSPSVQN